MSFYKINITPQNITKQNVTNLPMLKHSNKQLGQLHNTGNTKLSDDIRYDSLNSKNLDIDYDLIDPKYINVINFTNPDAPNYVNPYQNSNNKFCFLILINKYNKKILVILNNSPYMYALPGGANKILETFENSAVRNFKKRTNITIDKKKIHELLTSTMIIYNTKVQVKTYFCFSIEKNENFSFIKTGVNTTNVNLSWVPIKFLYQYDHPIFANYYKQLYSNLLQHLY